MFDPAPTPASGPVPFGRDTQSVCGLPPVSSRVKTWAKSSGSSSLNEASDDRNVTTAPFALIEGMLPLPGVPLVPEARDGFVVVLALTLRTWTDCPQQWVTDPSPRL